MIEELVKGIQTDTTMLTAQVIHTVYPELTLKEVFELLNDPIAVDILIQEFRARPNGSINELKGDLL